ncbi:MAG: hypothetical protein ABIG61_03170 [Planctomycetota bacterium]
MRLLASILTTLFISVAVYGYAAKNPVVYAPEISTVTIDGNLGDWTNASSWAEFGGWYPIHNPGLASTTQIQFAWNDTGNKFYVGIESTEGDGLILEVGGLYAVQAGQVPDANVDPSSSDKATQFQFASWYGGEPEVLVNQLGGVTTGVVAAYAYQGGTMTIEIEMPIYSDWSDDGTAIDLDLATDVYSYANVFNEWGDAGDSMVADDEYVMLGAGKCVEVASLVRLRLNAEPSDCNDVPDFMMDVSDINGDCNVDMVDFTELAWDWMACNDPQDPNCQ